MIKYTDTQLQLMEGIAKWYLKYGVTLVVKMFHTENRKDSEMGVSTVIGSGAAANALVRKGVLTSESTEYFGRTYTRYYFTETTRSELKALGLLS